MRLIFYFLLFVVFLATNGCSGNKSLESLFSAHPDLIKRVESSESKQPDLEGENEQLPSNFPDGIPLYPQAKLITADGNKTIWQSADPLNLISNYYREQLARENWSISQQEENSLVATDRNQNQQLKLTLIPGTNPTEFILEYQNLSTAESAGGEDSPPPQEPNEQAGQQVKINDDRPQEGSPLELTNYLQDLIALGAIEQQNKSLTPDRHQPITRRKYARWLVAANNTFHANNNSKVIRLASPNAQPVFTDVGRNDPDFTAIQGLAEAGLIPSALTEDSTAILFEPDKPLTREDLIAWKVPLDVRQGLPSASLETIRQTWGFQDAAKIKPQVWRSLYADWQNGDRANIRRAFGYTTLFQPKKEVALEEAAAVLWYFGYQGDGISAQELLKNESSN